MTQSYYDTCLGKFHDMVDWVDGEHMKTNFSLEALFVPTGSDWAKATLLKKRKLFAARIVSMIQDGFFEKPLIGKIMPNRKVDTNKY